MRLAGRSLAMLTDLYELTMACGYWKAGMTDVEATFHLTFRECPFEGGYAIAAGLEPAIEFLDDLRFDSDDLAYLASQTGNDGKPLFSGGFLDYLKDFTFRCDVDAIPEGTAVFPHEPLLRVSGPIIESQIVETALLNLVNFSTLIATKASRVVAAAAGDPVIDFGLRRAQGVDGGLIASRAAWIGGCSGTSNVLAGQLYGIPIGGTLAHSWVMAFDDEREAFATYANAMPNNTIFLVDTYRSVSGIENAIAEGLRLREQGYEMIGIRLDSGDLAELSRTARRMLDEAGLPDAIIAASSEFDEHVITRLKREGARIDLWGVGTRLVTGWDQPALGGIYKLAAVRRPDSPWKYRVKISEDYAKISNPGIQQVRRFEDEREIALDVIYDLAIGCDERPESVDLVGGRGFMVPPAASHAYDLLVPVFRDGRLVYGIPRLEDVRSLVSSQLGRLPPGVRRLQDADTFAVGLEKRLHELKTHLLQQWSGKVESRSAPSPSKH